MRLGVIANIEPDWRAALEKVRIAEDLGYELVTSGEAWGPSVLPWLTLVAANTERIRIGPSILNVYSRSPAAIAQEIAQIEQISGGRMILGLGSSGAAVIEHFHGLPFGRPLQRLREYVDVFRLLIAGEPLQYQGQIFTLERGFKLDYARTRTTIPIYIAAITPKSITQTGEIADGIFPIHWPQSQFAALRDQLAAAATAAGRPAGAVTIAPFTNVYLLDGADDDAQWQAARAPIHHYVNRMGDFYWQMLHRRGFAAEVEATRAAWAARDKAASLAAISESMIREIQVIGPIEAVREQLQQRSDLGAQLQMIPMPHGAPEEAGRRLQALRG